MRAIFVTGGTGFLGGYALTELLARSDAALLVLTRAVSEDRARESLWRALQLHMGPAEFYAALQRVTFVTGDLHAPGLGLSSAARDRILAEADSVLHIAASLNRKSSKACFNSNLRGTLSVLRLAGALHDRDRLRRYTHVSTVAVAGERSGENVREDASIDWGRSDYDPYARTKKFCEHMATELLPDASTVFVRPSIVLGDSRFPRTTQFDMLGAVCALADLPLVPLRPEWRVDIVNADFVGEAVARLHLAERPRHQRYHLSSGLASCTCADIGDGLYRSTGRRLRFAPSLERPTHLAVRVMDRFPRGHPVQQVGAMMKVFWPYITFDTVFDNSRVVAELGIQPTPFPTYFGPLYEFARRVKNRFPYAPLPPAQGASATSA